MKIRVLLLLLTASLIWGCSPTQKITGSWVNRAELPKVPYKSIFVIVISQNSEANRLVEDLMAKRITTKERKAVRCSEMIPEAVSVAKGLTKEQLSEAIKKSGCDAVFTIALLNVATVEHYVPGAVYAPYYPMSYGYYGSYWGYYNYYSPQVYSPGYYTSDRIYYLESNFYDLAGDKLLWSVQSETYNPTALKSWFNSYSYMLINHLKGEGVIKK